MSPPFTPWTFEETTRSHTWTSHRKIPPNLFLFFFFPPTFPPHIWRENLHINHPIINDEDEDKTEWKRKPGEDKKKKSSGESTKESGFSRGQCKATHRESWDWLLPAAHTDHPQYQPCHSIYCSFYTTSMAFVKWPKHHRRGQHFLDIAGNALDDKGRPWK